MRRTFAFVLLCWLPATAMAADWRVVATDHEPDWGRIIAFADIASLERRGNEIRAMVDMRIERPPVKSDGARTKLRADCSSYGYEVLGGDYYLGPTVRGPHPVEPWSKAEAGTNMYVLLTNLCSGRYLSGSVDPVGYAREQFGR